MSAQAAAEMIWGFYSKPAVTSSGRVLTWKVTEPEKVARMVLDLEGCPRSFLGWGASRLLASRRTIAMVIPDLEISHVTTLSGREVLYLNFSYVLFQDTGEMHFPKDSNKKQVGISAADELRLRSLALLSLQGMEELGYPLSPNFEVMVYTEVSNGNLPLQLPPPPLPPPPLPPPALLPPRARRVDDGVDDGELSGEPPHVAPRPLRGARAAAGAQPRRPLSPIRGAARGAAGRLHGVLPEDGGRDGAARDDAAGALPLEPRAPDGGGGAADGGPPQLNL